MWPKFVLIVLVAVAAKANAETRLVAAGDITVGENSTVTAVTNYVVIREKRPELKLDCRLAHDGVSHARTIKAGSKFIVKSVGAVVEYQLNVGPVAELKKQYESQYGMKFPVEIKTQVELDSFIKEKYETVLFKGPAYKLSIPVVYEPTNRAYVINCGSIEKFSVEQAFDAIVTSNILKYDPEF